MDYLNLITEGKDTLTIKLFRMLFVCLSVIAVYGCSTGTQLSHKKPQAALPLEFLPALNGDYFKLNSAIIGRPFHIYVRYPQGYDKNSDKTYPVVYLLDGGSLFPILAANH